jgi:hypothetical protein
LEAIGVPPAPVDQAALTRDMDATRERLGAPDWEQAWAAGAALSTQDAISLALTDDDPPAAATAGDPVGNPTRAGCHHANAR